MQNLLLNISVILSGGPVLSPQAANWFYIGISIITVTILLTLVCLVYVILLKFNKKARGGRGVAIATAFFSLLSLGLLIFIATFVEDNHRAVFNLLGPIGAIGLSIWCWRLS